MREKFITEQKATIHIPRLQFRDIHLLQNDSCTRRLIGFNASTH